jgi:hypothetical protein
MPLQSSGQISLSQIATEFGGSAPHSLSEYYGKGNAPASGEIQLAADFYGTSNSISLSTTINIGLQTLKAGIVNKGFISSSGRTVGTTNDNANGTTTTIGSIGNNSYGSGVVEALYVTEGTTVGGHMHFEISTSQSNWSSITVNGNTFYRVSFSNDANQLFTISVGGQNQTGNVFGSSGTINFSINA